MSIYRLKPRFQAMLRPIVQGLWRRGITANQVTVSAMAGSVLLGLLLAWQAAHPAVFCCLPLWMFIRMALNAIDGMLAREYQQQSVLGGYLNELGDMVSDAALFLPFACIPEISVVAVVLVVSLALISEAAGILGQVYTGVRCYIGPMGKSDRAALFSVVAIWYACLPQHTLPVNILLYIAVVLLLLTIVRRVQAGMVQEVL